MENFEAAKIYDSSNSSGDESDYQLEQLYGLSKVTDESTTQVQAAAITTKRKRGEEPMARLPTRKPDPNVFNRNALLARENRRKKKAYLESLEQSLQECKRVNKCLLEALKRQRKATRRVERERQYYKKLFNNRSSIANLVAAIKGPLNEAATTPACPSSLNQTHDVASSPTRDSLYSRSGSSNYEPDYQAFDNFENFSDNEFERHPAITLEDNWHKLINDEDIGLDNERLSSEADTNILTNISNDHCYDNQKSDADETLKDVGICLHLTAGKVSLEFCPACNWNANQTPPQQLLQENSAT